jgi:hypothetical protein
MLFAELAEKQNIARRQKGCRKPKGKSPGSVAA